MILRGLDWSDTTTDDALEAMMHRYTVKDVDGATIYNTDEREVAEQWVNRSLDHRFALDNKLGRKYEKGEWR